MLTRERLAEIREIRSVYEAWIQEGRDSSCPERIARSIAISHVGLDALLAVDDLLAENEELREALSGRVI